MAEDEWVRLLHEELGTSKEEKPIIVRPTRPSWDEIYMGLARSIARRSTCSRLHVGCVITTQDHTRVLAIGYNGGPKKLNNECLSTEPGKCGHLHAEINALIKLDFSEPKKVAYVTAMPCYACAVALVNAEVSRVVYGDTYRITDGVDLLRKAGIIVEQHTEGPAFNSTEET